MRWKIAFEVPEIQPCRSARSTAGVRFAPRAGVPWGAPACGGAALWRRPPCIRIAAAEPGRSSPPSCERRPSPVSGMTYHELRRLLPQQFPLIMVDRVLEHEQGVRLVGAKNVSANDIFFLGHFPGRAILPGALLLEGMAQCCVLLFQLAYAPLAEGELAV